MYTGKQTMAQSARTGVQFKDEERKGVYYSRSYYSLIYKSLRENCEKVVERQLRIRVSQAS